MKKRITTIFLCFVLFFTFVPNVDVHAATSCSHPGFVESLNWIKTGKGDSNGCITEGFRVFTCLICKDVVAMKSEGRTMYVSHSSSIISVSGHNSNGTHITTYGCRGCDYRYNVSNKCSGNPCVVPLKLEVLQY